MDPKELREFYNNVKLLASYEEKYNIPKDKRLTIYFSSYNMYVPIKTATKEILYRQLQYYKKKHAEMKLKEIHEHYDDIELLASYEERHNIPENERLTEWFGDYNMHEPKSGVTKNMIEERLKHYRNPDTEYKTLKLKGSNYSIKFKKGTEHNYKIFRHDEDVTEELNNNLVRDMFFEMLKLKDLW